MIWEQGAVVIVALCRLQENGEIACARYWPEEGAEVYHIYEVSFEKKIILFFRPRFFLQKRKIFNKKYSKIKLQKTFLSSFHPGTFGQRAHLV